MRLKKLEVFGFKSFFDKTTITFEKGITGIVGPNGCGKSNFADAILWVLGEQKPKNLRGERMEDVIFSGTEHRKALSVAEVSLTISDIKNELPSPYTPYAELCFSRRLYRSGECDYLINKNPCRLKDIRDLLIDIGAGYRAHTIIEQGKVDELITASPLQRRELVEEAAGIAKYRLRKAEALRKLEATERNLLRVSDIIGEIKRQRNALDRQAKKAERSQKLKEELKELEIHLAYISWFKKSEDQRRIESLEATLQDKIAFLSASLAKDELSLTHQKTKISDKTSILALYGREISESEAHIQRCEGKIETLRIQGEEWRSAQNRSRNESKHIEETIAQLTSEEQSLTSELNTIQTEQPEKEMLLRNNESQAAKASEAQDKDKQKLSQLKNGLFDLNSQLSTAHNNLLHFEARKEQLLRQQTRLEQEHNTISQRLVENTSKLTASEQVRLKNMEALSKAEQTRQVLSTQLQELEAKNRDNERSLQKSKERWMTLKAQSAAEERSYRGFSEKENPPVAPMHTLSAEQLMVADLLEVPQRYEHAIETLLENRLRGIVVDDGAPLMEHIKELATQKKGRGFFFPKRPRASALKETAPSGEGIEGAALTLIFVQPSYKDIATVLFAGVIIVEDIESALQQWKKHPEVETWLCLDGSILEKSGVSSAGIAGNAGVLSSKRILQALLQKVTESRSSCETLEQKREIVRGQIIKCQQSLSQSVEDIRTYDLARVQGENNCNTLKKEQENLSDSLETLLFELEEGQNEEENLLQRVQTEQKKIMESEALKEKQSALLSTLERTLEHDQAQLTVLKETVISLRLETHTLLTRHRHIDEKRERAIKEKKKLLNLRDEKRHFWESLAQKSKQAQIEMAQTSSKITEVSNTLNTQREKQRQETEAHATLLNKEQETEKNVSEHQKALNENKEHLQQQAMKRLEIVLNREKIEETIHTQYQCDIRTYDNADGNEKLSAEELAHSEKQLTLLRQQIETLGAVNLDAIEEYLTLDTRFQFLETQEKDLRQSIESLNAAITKINKTTKGLFVETFHTLNQKFSEVYTSFFGGGSAELVLSDESKPLDSGIELFAQPPGKGKRNVLLLSGGEKALTAISLLFATFLIHPTPFCLLDEIDAPLDEENTRRFSQTLVEMSEETQFIVVTHNKHTMEIADVLYGVTMEETGLSKLVSVDLKKMKV